MTAYCERPDCGTVFEPRHSTQRFCSSYCRILAWERANRRRPGYPERPCERCAQPYKPLTHNQRFCGERCRNADWMARYRSQQRQRELDGRPANAAESPLLPTRRVAAVLRRGWIDEGRTMQDLAAAAGITARSVAKVLRVEEERMTLDKADRLLVAAGLELAWHLELADLYEVA